jgi:hypothetical protein
VQALVSAWQSQHAGADSDEDAAAELQPMRRDPGVLAAIERVRPTRFGCGFCCGFG